jgi:PAS domain S-box-containing protein
MDLADSGPKTGGGSAGVKPLRENAGANLELGAKDESFRSLLDAIPHIAWATKPDGTVVYINARWGEYTGVDGTDNEKIRSAIHPDDLDRVIQLMTHARATGEHVPYDLRLRKHDGDYRWHRVASSPMLDHEGKVKRWIGTSTDVHDEVLALESLRESVDHHRYRIETSPQIPWLADANGMIYQHSPQWLELTGLTDEEAQTSQMSILHPEDAPRMIEAWTQSLKSGDPFDFEHRVRLANGAYRWIRSRATARRDKDGSILRWYGTSEDIHERKQAVEALSFTQHSLALALKGGRMGWWTRDLLTQTVTWSPELEELFGLAPGKFKGTEETFLAYVHPDDQPLVISAVGAALLKRTDYSVEFRFNRADGTQRWMEGRGIATYDKSGNPNWIYGIGIDITERKEAEAALRESEERFRAIAEASPQFIWSATPDGGTDYRNSQYLAFIGKTMEESNDWSWTDIVHPLDRDRALEDWQRSLREGQEMQTEMRIRGGGHQDYRWHLSKAVPARNAEGQVIRWYGILSDIQAHKEEAEVLERLVRERTAELQRAYSEQESFSYSVSHDLRSPLRAIIASARMLEEDCADLLPPEFQTILRKQAAAATKLARLIDDLLELSKVGRRDLSFGQIDLSALFGDVALAMGVPDAVELTIEPGLVACGDAGLLRLVAQNYLENAFKFSPHGGEVTVGRREDAFFVSDQGVGFQMEYHNKLFQPFQRLHREEEFAGTGIGLATVRRIIERHGGRVWAESKPGEGATFFFTLPQS